jgi:hypothetical protein
LQTAGAKKSRTFSSCKLQEQKNHELFLLANCRSKKITNFFFLQIAGAKKSRTFSSCKLQEQKNHELFLPANGGAKLTGKFRGKFKKKIVHCRPVKK